MISIPLDACLRKLYVMAFTSGLTHARTRDYHKIELHYNESVHTMTLYDKPGSQFSLNKGDLWDFNLPGCITLHEITGVSVVANGDDGWHIESIVTLVQDIDNRIQLLTRDFSVNRWIDMNEDEQEFKLTLSNHDNNISSGKIFSNNIIL